MLYYFDHTVERIAPEDERMIVIAHAINAFAEAKHLVWLSLTLINNLINEGGLTAYHKQVLHEMKTFSRESKYLYRKLEKHITVALSPHEVHARINGNEVIIPYKKLLDSSAWQASPVVVENLSDADIYKKSALYRTINLNMHKAYSINISAKGGGGGNSLSVFEQQLTQSPSTLCILDSDKSHPEQTPGSTARSFKEYIKRPSEKYHIEVLDSREIENIIPVRLLMQLEREDLTVISEDFFEIVEKGYRKYLDHKKGLKSQHAVEIDKKQNKEYWSNLINEIPTREWISIGLEENIANKVLNYINDSNNISICKLIDDQKDEEWNKIGNLILAWGICNRKQVKFSPGN